MLKWSCIILFFCTWASAASADKNDIFDLGKAHFEIVGDTDNIPYGIVTSLIQDQQGFLWIGTQHGLVRYDGYYFKKFNYSANDPNSISGDYIQTLWLDNQGKIWIGTASDGISIYDPITNIFQHIKHDSNNDNSLSSNRINTILGDNKKHVWIGTNNGLNLYDKATGTIVRLNHDKGSRISLNDNRVSALFIDNKNTLWVGTGSGLNKLKNSYNGKFEFIDIPSNIKNQLTNTLILYIHQNENGKTWIGTKKQGAFWISSTNNIGKVISDNSAFSFISKAWIVSILEVNKHEIWLGSFTNGVIVVDAITNKVLHHFKHDKTKMGTIPNNDISALFKDNSGLIWVGTWGGSFSRMNPYNSGFKTIRHSLTQKNIISSSDIRSVLALDNGLIWVGTKGNGIDIIDPKIGLIGGFRALTKEGGVFEDGVIMSLAQTSDGIIWIGTRESGLYKYNSELNEFKHYTTKKGLIDNNIRRIMPTKHGKLWLATSAGINRFDPRSEIFETFSTVSKPNELFINVFNSLAEQANGTVWAGSHGGLYALPLGEKQFIHITANDTNKKSISHNNIPGILVDSKDRLWVDTRYGLNRLVKWQGKSSEFESISTYMKQDGLYFGGNLLEDQLGRIWTQWYMVNPNKWRLNKLPISEDASLGTPWLGSFTKTKKGTLIYGGTKGILLIKPEKFQQWTYQPPLQISQLKIDGNKTNSINLKHLSLSPKVKNLNIEFTALDYSGPNKIKYNYKLDGFDTDWISADPAHRTINYTNLDPGDYTLFIKNSNKDGNWNKQPFSLKITQQPSWYQTLWMKLIFLLLFASTIYTMMMLRVKNLKIQKKILRKQVTERTADILLLGEIGKELTSKHNFEEVLEQVYKKINKVLDAHVLLLATLDIQNNQIKANLIIENNIKMKPVIFDLKNNDYPAAWCVNNKKELILTNKSDFDNFFNRELVSPKFGNVMNSIVYQPLIIRDQLLGCLSIQSPQFNAFTEEQLDMIRTLASYTAISTANTLGFEKLNKANKKLESAHEELKTVCDDLEKVSLTDQLTGAHNRRFLNKFIPQELAKVQRDHYMIPDHTNSGFGFILIDIDHFKYINDTFGHDAGDKVLIQIVQILKQTCRDFDWVIRWGGEEFLVVSRFTQRDQMSILAERIRTTIEEFVFDLGEGRTINRTCSMGIAGFPFIQKQAKAFVWEQTLQLADLALYVVKNNGRNGWISLFENHIVEAEAFYTEALTHLDHVIEQGEISFETSLDPTKVIFK